MRDMFWNAIGTEVEQKNWYINYTANLSWIIVFHHILSQFSYQKYVVKCGWNFMIKMLRLFSIQRKGNSTRVSWHHRNIGQISC